MTENLAAGCLACVWPQQLPDDSSESKATPGSRRGEDHEHHRKRESSSSSSVDVPSSLMDRHGGRYPCVEQEVLLSESAKHKSRYKHVASHRILRASPRY